MAAIWRKALRFYGLHSPSLQGFRSALLMVALQLLLRVFLVALTFVHPIGASAQDQAASANLPTASQWKQHLERDILPFWQTPAALGTPVGNFPTARCNDGSPVNPQSPCAEDR